MFKRIKEFIEEMNATNSTLDKKEVLSRYAELKTILNYVYDPFRRYYITSKNILKNPDLIKDTDEGIFQILCSLSERTLSGHEAIATINGFINKNLEYKDIILKIIDKDLECRIGDSIINNVFPNLIPTFDVALANSYKDVETKVDIFDGSWYASHKLDGCLSAETIVELKNSGRKTIKYVVENKIEDEIKCYDEKNKKITFSKIEGYGKDIEIKEEIKWFEIELEDGRKIKATANHPFFMPEIDAYRRTDQLKVEDFLLID